MATLTEARRAVRDLRRQVREASSAIRDGELAAFEAWDAAAVKPPARTVNPRTGKLRRDYSGGEWDWTRGRPQWQLRVLIGGSSAVYGPDELLDVLRGAGILGESDDLDTWADRVLSARQRPGLTVDDAAAITGQSPYLLSLVLEGDLDACAASFLRWDDEMNANLSDQYAQLRARQAEISADVERFAEKVRHERYDVGRTWQSIADELGVSRSRALRIAHPNGKPRDDDARAPQSAPAPDADPVDYGEPF
jgi:hypothetical protein